jgi:hypothetical protein
VLAKASGGCSGIRRPSATVKFQPLFNGLFTLRQQRKVVLIAP